MTDTILSIVIVEDDAIYRENLVYLFDNNPGMECAGSFSTVKDFLSGEPETYDKIYWIDINLPDGSGIDLIRFLRSKNPTVLCMVCSLYDDDRHIFEAMRAGAGGYLLKSASPDQMITGIKELASGGAPMSPYIARKLMESFRETPGEESIKNKYDLSNREEEVLQHIAKGLLYKEVAAVMHISTETVKKHLRNTYAKLQVQNRTEAVVKYLRLE